MLTHTKLPNSSMASPLRDPFIDIYPSLLITKSMNTLNIMLAESSSDPNDNSLNKDTCRS